MNNCSEEHSRMYNTKEGLGSITLCYHNEQTEWLQSIIRNQVSLIVCENHREKYVFETSPPLSMEAAEATMKDLYTKK